MPQTLGHNEQAQASAEIRDQVVCSHVLRQVFKTPEPAALICKTRITPPLCRTVVKTEGNM